MEKMNQVSVSEFFAKSKEEMYDMAVEMVEKYNRLVDICNDSAERMSELMAKDDINEFKKELQSKAPGEFKIQKLADIVVWADNWITELKDGLTEEEFENDKEVKEFETVKKVVLESMERRTVYSNALNNDIAEKAAKIDLLEKEIEGRKEGYYALKKRMDTDYITIEEHNNICEDFKKKIEKLKKESEKWQDLAKMNRDTICNQYDVCEDFKKKIAELEEENEKLKVDLIHEREKNEKLAKDHAVQENDIRKYTTEIKTLEEKVKRQKENLDGINKTLEIRTDQLRATESKVEELWEEIEHLRDLGEHWKRSYFNTRYSLNKLKDESKEDDHGKSGFKRYIEHLIEEEERAVPERFKERLNQEITEIFTKEEETEIKGNGRTSSGRYPWSAKVNDIPCGEDAIE